MERSISRHHAQLLEGRRRLPAGVCLGSLGSADLFEHQGRKSWASVNFVTAHDGFTLADLYAYNEKHNEANQEDNRDGHDDNRSWNCGVEGPTDDPAILDLRDRMRRNIVATLLLSQGTPMLLMGDEIGRTQNGNNNAYCQDNEMNWLAWSDIGDRESGFLAFVRGMIAVRKRHPVLTSREFLHGRSLDDNGTRDAVWFRPDGAEMDDASWGDGRAKVVGLLLSEAGRGTLDPRQRLSCADGLRFAEKRVGELAGDGRHGNGRNRSGAQGRGRGVCAARWPFAASALREVRMTDRDGLYRLAARAGIDHAFVSMTGDTVTVSDDALRAVLGAMGIAAATDADVATSLAIVSPMQDAALEVPPGVVCHVPDWLANGRCWGITCQVYSLRSARNWGLGDFEDLGLMAEMVAAAGADFLGVNPLHALFMAAPDRCSPFFPSSRQFLNPLYIAVDKVSGADELGDALEFPEEIRARDLIDYAEVGPIKRKALGFLFRLFEDRGSEAEATDFAGFVAERGRSLYLHALFESLSEEMVERGHGATWHNWPDEYRDPGTEAVRSFASNHAASVTFHSWLQWLADRQLAAAQARAIAAGMRIGLYLDLAVGVAPDGSDTWADPDLVVPGARIGAPPDYFNAAGQDWGLAPLSPSGLAAHDFKPYRQALDTVLRHAGALRVDHAMGLYRLYWIASGLKAADGVYVNYPFQSMLRTLADVSRHRRTIVIGEDLGVVPSGFREAMRAAEMQSYRVLFFEKTEDFFIPPEDYPREAVACMTIHDLHTLAGWWRGRDLEVLHAAGVLQAHNVGKLFEQRAHERRRLLGLMAEKDLLPPAMVPVMKDEARAPVELPPEVAVALHRLVARTPCRLVTVAAEDLTGMVEQVNVPGTTVEHPNWQRKLPVAVEDIAALPLFGAITGAMRAERPAIA